LKNAYIGMVQRTNGPFSWGTLETRFYRNLERANSWQNNLCHSGYLEGLNSFSSMYARRCSSWEMDISEDRKTL
jgi:hypothetical protein